MRSRSRSSFSWKNKREMQKWPLLLPLSPGRRHPIICLLLLCFICVLCVCERRGKGEESWWLKERNKRENECQTEIKQKRKLFLRRRASKKKHPKKSLFSDWMHANLFLTRTKLERLTLDYFRKRIATPHFWVRSDNEHRATHVPFLVSLYNLTK